MIFSETADLVMSGDKTQTRRPLKPFDELRTTDEGRQALRNFDQSLSDSESKLQSDWSIPAARIQARVHLYLE